MKGKKKGFCRCISKRETRENNNRSSYEWRTELNEGYKKGQGTSNLLALINISKTHLQKSQGPETHEKVWNIEELIPLKEDWFKEHLNKLDIQMPQDLMVGTHKHWWSLMVSVFER